MYILCNIANVPKVNVNDDCYHNLHAGTASPTASENKDLKEKHDKLLSDMEKQYETSRFMTHLAKGVGLGYGTLSSSSNLDNSSSSSSLP